MKSLKIYTDGGSRGNPGKAACAFVVVDNGKVLYKQGFYLGRKTNNEAEYFGVIKALEWLSREKLPLKEAVFFLDSELLTRQLSGEYRVKSKNLIPLKKTIESLQRGIDGRFIFRSIPREKNRLADWMVNQVLDKLGV